MIALVITPAVVFAFNGNVTSNENNTNSVNLGFITTNATETTNIPIIHKYNQLEITQAFLISVLIEVAIIVLVYRIVRHKKSEHPKLKWAFWNIIRDETWYPSLSLFQFFLWTIVIIFSFLFLSFIRIEGGNFQPLGIQDQNLLYLMGISITSPIVSGGLSSIKYKTVQRSVTPQSLPPYSTMLEENGSPSVTRFQMFAWTIIGIIAYLIILFSEIPIPGVVYNVGPLALPSISPILVVLMGLSQTAYVGGKAVSQVSKASILPESGNAGTTIIIYGNDFLPNLNNQNKVTFVDQKGISVDGECTNWTNTLISVKIPTTVSPNEYDVLVITSTNIINAGKFTVSGPPTK